MLLIFQRSQLIFNKKKLQNIRSRENKNKKKTIYICYIT